MSITITANDVDDALAKLRRREHDYGIRIRWRRGEPFDYQNTMETGCIVNAVGLPGQEVERSFNTAGEALRYIATLLKMVDARAREQKAERAKHARDALKAKKEKK